MSKGPKKLAISVRDRPGGRGVHLSFLDMNVIPVVDIAEASSSIETEVELLPSRSTSRQNTFQMARSRSASQSIFRGACRVTFHSAIASVSRNSTNHGPAGAKLACGVSFAVGQLWPRYSRMWTSFGRFRVEIVLGFEPYSSSMPALPFICRAYGRVTLPWQFRCCSSLGK